MGKVVFQVLRHSGRANGYWRLLVETEDAAKAEEIYEKEAQKLRQGVVCLKNNQGECKYTWAPMLKRYW